MRALWISALLLAAGPALAQLVTLEPGAAQRCLTPTPELRGTPVYPEGPYKRQEQGRVRVELTFKAADKAPAVAVLSQSGSDDFVEAVKEHVEKLRVPCLTEDEGSSLLQIEFVFTPDGRRVYWPLPSDPSRAAKAAQLKCVRHVSGETKVAYPMFAREAGTQGRVLAQLTFTAADQAPEARLFARTNSRRLRAAVEDWVQGLRMPCHGGEPVQAIWTFIFTLDNNVFGFRPMNLLDYMGLVRDIQEQTLNFDFNGMACPFDVRLQYRKPFLPNHVGQVGSTHPARSAFLDWLARSELNLAPPAADAVFGDALTLTIPCTKINLNPKEKS